MLTTYMLCFMVHLYSAIETIRGDYENIKIAELLQIIFTMLSVLMQFYFIITLKRVRAWLEAKEPLELEVKLSNVRKWKWIVTILYLSFFAVYSIEFLFLRNLDQRVISYVTSVVYDFQMILLIGTLMYLSISQYRYFINKRIS